MGFAIVRQGLFVPAFILISLAAAAAPFVVPAIPVGSDTLKHAFVAKVIADYRDPALGFARDFELTLSPRSTLLGELLLAGLVKVSPSAIDAVRVYYALFVLVLWSGAALYFRRVGHPVWASVAVLPLAHSFYAFSGYLPFLMAIAVYPWLLAALAGARSRSRTVLIAGILLLMYGFHLVGVLIGGLTVALYAIDRTPRGWTLRLADLMAIVPAAAITVFFMLQRTAGGGGARYYGVVGQLKAFFGYNVWGLYRPGGYVLLALIVALLAVFAAALLRRGAGDPRLAILVVVLVCAGVVMPYEYDGWFVVGSRTLPFALIAALGYLRLSVRAWAPAAAGAMIFLLFSAAGNTQAALAVQDDYARFLAAVPAVAPAPRLLPIIENTELGGNQYIKPFLAIEDAYNIARGGSNAYAFAAPAVLTGAVALRFRYSPEYRERYADHPLDYRGMSRIYDHVLLWGNLPRVAEQVGRELCVSWSRPPLTIYSRCDAGDER